MTKLSRILRCVYNQLSLNLHWLCKRLLTNGSLKKGKNERDLLQSVVEDYKDTSDSLKQRRPVFGDETVTQRDMNSRVSSRCRDLQANYTGDFDNEEMSKREKKGKFVSSEPSLFKQPSVGSHHPAGMWLVVLPKKFSYGHSLQQRQPYVE